MKKIAIFYNFFPHYRAGIINEIIKRYGEAASFYAADLGEANIKVHPIDGQYFKCIRRIKIFNFEYHVGVIKEAMFGSHDVYLYLANPYFISTWVAAVLCRIRRRKVIFWGHGFLNNKKSFKNYLRALFFGLADVFLAYNERSIDIAKNNLLDISRWYPIYNSLPIDLNEKYKLIVSDSPGAEQGVLNIICISRLNYGCRYDILFDAVAELVHAHAKSVVVRMIGTGDHENQLKDLARQHEIDVRFLGEIYTEDEIEKYMKISDVCVMPGRIGLTAIHALSNGVPVISHSNFDHQMPESEVILDGVTGYFFTMNDFASLVDKLLLVARGECSRNVSKFDCFRVVAEIYNAENQVNIIQRAIDGLSPIYFWEDFGNAYKLDHETKIIR